MAADELEHLETIHQFVPGQEDHAHSAAAQLTKDVLVGVGGKAGWPGAGPGRRSETRGAVEQREVFGCGDDGSVRVANPVCLMQPAEEAMGGEPGDATAAVRARFEMLVDRLC